MKNKVLNKIITFVLAVALIVPTVAGVVKERSAFRRDLTLKSEIDPSMNKYNNVLNMLYLYLDGYTIVTEEDLDYMFSNGFPYSLNDKDFASNYIFDVDHLYDYSAVPVVTDEWWYDIREVLYPCFDNLSLYSLVLASFGFMDNVTKEEMLKYAELFDDNEYPFVWYWHKQNKIYSAYFDINTKRFVRVTDDLYAKGKVEYPSIYVCKEEYLVLKNVDLAKAGHTYTGAYAPDGSNKLGPNGGNIYDYFAKYKEEGYPTYAELGADLSVITDGNPNKEKAKNKTEKKDKTDKTNSEKKDQTPDKISRTDEADKSKKTDNAEKTELTGADEINEKNDDLQKFPQEDSADLNDKKISIVEETTVKEPTCEENGVKIFTYNDGSTKEEIIPSTGHEYELTESISATCEHDGKNVYKCAKCGNTIEEAIPKTEHSFVSEVVKDAACEEEGETRKTCEICGIVELEKIPATGHTEEVKEIVATFLKKGSITTKCTKCGKTLSYVEYPAKTGILAGVAVVLVVAIGIAVVIVSKRKK